MVRFTLVVVVAIAAGGCGSNQTEPSALAVRPFFDTTVVVCRDPRNPTGATIESQLVGLKEVDHSTTASIRVMVHPLPNPNDLEFYRQINVAVAPTDGIRTTGQGHFAHVANPWPGTNPVTVNFEALFCCGSFALKDFAVWISYGPHGGPFNSPVPPLDGSPRGFMAARLPPRLTHAEYGWTCGRG